MIRRLTEWLARRQSFELHYPPQPDPPQERAPTRVSDGSPCRGWPDDGERYESRKAAARQRDEYR